MMRFTNCFYQYQIEGTPGGRDSKLVLEILDETGNKAEVEFTSAEEVESVRILFESGVQHMLQAECDGIESLKEELGYEEPETLTVQDVLESWQDDD